MRSSKTRRNGRTIDVKENRAVGETTGLLGAVVSIMFLALTCVGVSWPSENTSDLLLGEDLLPRFRISDANNGRNTANQDWD
ncbi:hypothetical protein HN011_010603 [Eciton burchellii]|nr:hypothetical protein HN011_010603 [Eciton burchellii]